jgi:periplasmic mercuric ion binding protein
MKKLAILSMAIGAFLTGNKVQAQDSKTETFKVFGNCGICKKRIEKATAGEGITKADWNVDTKIMTVSYDPSKITNEAIQKKIAAAGHDTEKQKAADAMYNKLPGCCQYDRKGAESSAHHDHK